MLSKEEKKQIHNEIVTELLACQRYTEQDILNRYPYSVGEIRMLIWEARELLRVRDGIDFGPLRKWPGVFERKEWSQIAVRAARQRAKGTRAHRRAEERLRLAATLAPDAEKQRLNDAADREKLRLAMRKSRQV